MRVLDTEIGRLLKMAQEKIIISGENIVNQQRFPKMRFGWPLMEAASIIIEGGPGWRSEAEARMQRLINKRKNLKNLGELYRCNALNEWSIDHMFVPWFSNRPLKTGKLSDLDYTEQYLPASSIIDKLCALISSLEKRGYVEPSENSDAIIGYPINSESNYFYIRAGNHRAAVLSALDLQIPLVLDRVKYLKSRDLAVISKRTWSLGRMKPIDSYPTLRPTNCWPAVKSRVITSEAAASILSAFLN